MSVGLHFVLFQCNLFEFLVTQCQHLPLGGTWDRSHIWQMLALRPYQFMAKYATDKQNQIFMFNIKQNYTNGKRFLAHLNFLIPIEKWLEKMFTKMFRMNHNKQPMQSAAIHLRLCIAMQIYIVKMAAMNVHQ
jgi:hypothetical protein